MSFIPCCLSTLSGAVAVARYRSMSGVGAQFAPTDAPTRSGVIRAPLRSFRSRRLMTAKDSEVIWSPSADVHDVGDEGCYPSELRRGSSYLASSIATTEGCRSASNAFSYPPSEQSRGRCSMTTMVRSNRSSGFWPTWLRSNGRRPRQGVRTGPEGLVRPLRRCRPGLAGGHTRKT